VYEPRLEEHFFAIPRGFSVKRFLGQGFGRMRGQQNRRVVLRVGPPASGWVGRNRWHPSQKVSRRRGGALRLSMTCPITDSLVRWVLQMGECVTIEAPEVLRKAVVAKAEACVRGNRG
jgi:predicted DNA-binding transcriptional regulator YafY